MFRDTCHATQFIRFVSVKVVYMACVLFFWNQQRIFYTIFTTQPLRMPNYSLEHVHYYFKVVLYEYVYDEQIYVHGHRHSSTASDRCQCHSSYLHLDFSVARALHASSKCCSGELHVRIRFKIHPIDWTGPVGLQNYFQSLSEMSIKRFSFDLMTAKATLAWANAS